MAKPLDTKEIVTIQEIAISNMLEIEALIKILMEKGAVSKEELVGKTSVFGLKKLTIGGSLCLSPRASTQIPQDKKAIGIDTGDGYQRRVIEM